MEVIRDDGRSILLSSHNTREVEQVADRITFIDRGRIVMSDDRESCIDRWRRVIVELTGDATLPDLPGAWMMSRAGSVACTTHFGGSGVTCTELNSGSYGGDNNGADSAGGIAGDGG